MADSSLTVFLSGMVTMGYAVAAAFLARFWVRTRDGLFAAFALAFALLAVGQALQVVLDIPREERSWVYLFRLAAFLAIIVAVLRKNVGRR